MANQNVKAVFTFVSLEGCGYCDIYKGVVKDKNGAKSIDQNSGWETLKRNQDLAKAGVKLELLTVKREDMGKLGARFQKRIRGFPHLELALPNDLENGVPFDGKLTGWEASKSVPVIRDWILSKLEQDPFKSYRTRNSVSAPGVHVYKNQPNEQVSTTFGLGANPVPVPIVNPKQPLPVQKKYTPSRPPVFRPANLRK